jgi:hypothetical protein
MPLLKRCFPDNLRDAAIENAHVKSSLSFVRFCMRLCINPQTGSMPLHTNTGCIMPDNRSELGSVSSDLQSPRRD